MKERIIQVADWAVDSSGKSLFHHCEEIIRCRDCGFSHKDMLGNLRCNGPLTEPWDYYNDEPSDGAKVEPSGFCAWAKRKEDSNA